MTDPVGAVEVNLDSLHAIVLDFDGVLTDNRVLVSEDGEEMAWCSRADGLAFDALRKLEVPVVILTTETRSIARARALKLRCGVEDGVYDKGVGLRQLADREGWELSKILYTGNDVNDLPAMDLCGWSACPSDSHRAVLARAQIHLRSRGGQGVVRELVEDVLGVDLVTCLYSDGA